MKFFFFKDTDKYFYQVDPDHTQEWLNGAGKRSDRIVGITRTTSALSRWSVSYNMLTCVAAQTKEMLQLQQATDEPISIESTAAWTKRDNEVEEKHVTAVEQLKVFDTDSPSPVHQNMAMRDLLTKPFNSPYWMNENWDKHNWIH